MRSILVAAPIHISRARETEQSIQRAFSNGACPRLCLGSPSLLGAAAFGEEIGYKLWDSEQVLAVVGVLRSHAREWGVSG